MITYTKTFTRPNNTVAWHWKNATFLAQFPESSTDYIQASYPGALLQQTAKFNSENSVEVTIVFSSVAGITTDPVVQAYDAGVSAYCADNNIQVSSTVQTV